MSTEPIGRFADLKADLCEGLSGVYSTIWCLCYKTNELLKKKQKEKHWACLHRLKKKGEPSWPRNTGRLSHRVPPAAMSRALIASPACDCGTCLMPNWEG